MPSELLNVKNSSWVIRKQLNYFNIFYHKMVANRHRKTYIPSGSVFWSCMKNTFVLKTSSWGFNPSSSNSSYSCFQQMFGGGDREGMSRMDWPVPFPPSSSASSSGALPLPSYRFWNLQEHWEVLRICMLTTGAWRASLMQSDQHGRAWQKSATHRDSIGRPPSLHRLLLSLIIKPTFSLWGGVGEGFYLFHSTGLIILH